MHLLIMTTLLGSAPAIEVGAVGTERFLGQKRAGGGVGAGAAAAANPAVAALAALPFERARIAELLKHGRVVPDGPEALHARVAGADRQVAARIDAPFVGD